MTGDRARKLESALEIARPAMWKAQHDGSHEQDRWDAMVWLELFGGPGGSRCTCAKCDKLWSKPGLDTSGSLAGRAYASRGVSHG